MEGKVMDLSKCGGVCKGACKHYAIGEECPPEATYEPKEIELTPLTLEEVKQWMAETEGKGGIGRRDLVSWLIAEVESLAKAMERHSDASFKPDWAGYRQHQSERDELAAHLATVTAERDELASALEAAERAAKASGEEAKAANERADELRLELGKAQGRNGENLTAISHLKADIFMSRQGFEAIDRMRVEALEDADAANERAEKMEARYLECRRDIGKASRREADAVAARDRAEARAKVMRSALEMIAWGSEYPIMAKIAREALQEPSND